MIGTILGFSLPLVCREYGHAMVRFALNVPDGQPMSKIDWTKGRKQALEILLGGVIVADLDHEGQAGQFRNAIHAYSPAARDSILRTLRVLSGGHLTSVERGVDPSQEPATKSLIRLINRYEKDLQAIVKRDDAWQTVPSLFGDHDAIELTSEIMSAASLKVIRDAFAERERLKSGRSIKIITPGGSNQFHETGLPELLLGACVSRVMIHGQELSSESLRKHASVVVRDFTALMGGEPITVPVAVGVIGPRLFPAKGRPDGLLPAVEERDKVMVGDGYLRPTTHTDRRLFTMAHDQIGLVWVTDEKTQVRVCDDPISDEELIKTMESLRADLCPIEDRWHLVSEAIILASKDARPPAWIISEFFKGSLVQSWESAWHARAAVGDASLSELSPRDFGDVVHWYRLLLPNGKALRTTRRRLVSAIVGRQDPVDSLVDAVVAWEGIFSGSPETQMRTVYPSCKMLSLYVDVDVDQTLRSMKSVYALRSKLVHGSQEKVRDDEVRDSRDQAVQWVIQLLRAILVDRHDLLEMTAPGRSETILVRSSPVGAPTDSSRPGG